MNLAALFWLLSVVFGVSIFGFGVAPTYTSTGEMVTTTATTGQDIYDMNCKMCHGVDGTQIPGVALFDKAFLQPRDVAAIVRDGNGGMPSFRGRLTDDEIETVAEWVEANAK